MGQLFKNTITLLNEIIMAVGSLLTWFISEIRESNTSDTQDAKKDT